MTGEQPGYDQCATAYDAAFPSGYSSDVERAVLALFSYQVRSAGLNGPVLDIGCGAGHITHDLAERGLDVLGVDPSAGMLALARSRYPSIDWLQDDACLSRLPDDSPAPAAVVARFSLIHVDPSNLDDILDGWSRRLLPGGLILTAFQTTEESADKVLEFDHKVARAWRWSPDAMSDALTRVGLEERWRLVTRPDETHRFPGHH